MIPASLSLKVYKFQAVAIAVAAAFLLGSALSGFGTWRVLRWMDASAALKVERVESADRVTEGDRQHDIGVRHATQRNQIETTFTEISDATDAAITARPDLRELDLGADVLCVWAAANAGRTTTEAGCRAQPAMPAAAATGEQQSSNAGKEPRTDSEVVPPGVRGPRGPD